MTHQPSKSNEDSVAELVKDLTYRGYGHYLDDTMSLEEATRIIKTFVDAEREKAVEEARKDAVAGKFFNRVDIKEEVNIPREIVKHIEDRAIEAERERIKLLAHSKTVWADQCMNILVIPKNAFIEALKPTEVEESSHEI